MAMSTRGCAPATSTPATSPKRLRKGSPPRRVSPGLAIVPTVGKLTAPITGKVVVAFPSGHAFAIRGKGADGKNVEVLMHIGFDTVNLKGEHFKPVAQQGDEVQAGDLLGEFDIDAIKAAGYEVTTPIMVGGCKTGSRW